jgi:membrane protease YdiL (CAAX protease family)
MIQRIQTIYLLVVVFLQTVMLFSEQASIIDGINEQSVALAQNWQWVILISLTALIPVFTIFLFKKRRLQIRFSIINSLLLLTLQIIVIYTLSGISNENVTVTYSATCISPAISLILTILAIRFILKDEMKIRAYNRIR